MRKALPVVIIVGLIGLASAAWAEPLKVFVSILPQKYIVQAVGGDRVQVSVLVPPGADPHVYEPRPRQMVELSRAALFFAIGIEFERAWLPRAAKDLPRLRVAHMEAGIERRPEQEGDQGRGRKEVALDPHVWVSPPLVRQLARNTAQALRQADPAHAKDYAAGQARLEADLDRLDAELRQMFQGLEGRSFVTFHPAWGYFAQAYGLRQVAVEVEGKEPKPAQLKQLIEEGRALGVRVVLVQPQFSRRSAETVALALGGRVVVANDLAEDLPDNLRRVAEEIRQALR
jgi:zinc transport system substrate-binding protein